MTAWHAARPCHCPGANFRLSGNVLASDPSVLPSNLSPLFAVLARDFYSACTDLYGDSGCRTDFVAVHFYECNGTTDETVDMVGIIGDRMNAQPLAPPTEADTFGFYTW